MTSPQPDTRLPTWLLLYRITSIITALTALIIAILMGILPPHRDDDEDGWGPVGPQLPYLSIIFLSIVLILNIEEVTRLLMRQTRKRWDWQTYPALIIQCDFLVGFAVFLTTFVFHGGDFGGHRSRELRRLESLVTAVGMACGGVHIVWAIGGGIRWWKVRGRKGGEVGK